MIFYHHIYSIITPPQHNPPVLSIVDCLLPTAYQLLSSHITRHPKASAQWFANYVVDHPYKHHHDERHDDDDNNNKDDDNENNDDDIYDVADTSGEKDGGESYYGQPLVLSGESERGEDERLRRHEEACESIVLWTGMYVWYLKKRTNEMMLYTTLLLTVY